MLDDFFIRALVAGLGIAIVTGPLGCFVIWRRLSYFGDTLAHSALLGVTLAYTFEFNIAISVFIISSLIALILIDLQKRTNLPGDALLGLLAHSSLAVGLVVIGFLTFIRFDIMGLLFGDILAVTVEDIFIILDSYDIIFNNDYLRTEISTVEALDKTNSGLVPLTPSIKYNNQKLFQYI